MRGQTSMIRTLVALLVASSYVAGIHWRVPSTLKNRDRNDEQVIRFRLKRITSLCCYLVIVTPFVMWQASWSPSYSDALRRLGVVVGYTTNPTWRRDVMGCVQALLLMVVLYTGPIVDYVVQNPVRNWHLDFTECFCTLHGVRDHIIGPLTEELIYRSVILALMESPHIGRRELVCSPLFFGVAHVHHAYELYRRKALPVSMIAFNALVQISYTTLFGVFANHIFLKHRTLWACVVVHSFCNIMSFPDPTVSGSPAYRCFYYGLLCLGVYGFYSLL